MTCHGLFKVALLMSVLSGALLLDGCGRRGPPVPIDSVAAQKPADKNNPNAPPAKDLPTGLDSKSLKAGAPRTPTPFDFLL